MKHGILKRISTGLCLTVLITTLSGCGSRPGSPEPGINSPSGELPTGFSGPETNVFDDGDLQTGVGDSTGNVDLQSASAASTGNVNLQSASAVPAEEVDAEIYTDFAVRLFRESMGETQNVLISPLSVINALAMTANGAKGETLAQMEHLFGADISSLSKYLRDLNQTLPNEENCKLHLANSIWYRDRQSFSVKKEFLEKNTDFFHAEVYPSAFDNAALQEMNSWVSDHTDGMIPQIIDRIEEDAVMYLINALAFDALWLEPYEKYQIQEDYFIPETRSARPSDSQMFPGIRVQMMHSRENVLLRDIDDQGRTAALGFLKYYTGKKYALAALLPEEGTSISDYVNSLSGEKICRILEDASAAEINAALPKFEADYSVSMKDILTAMGMTDAFDSAAADLSDIGSCLDGRLYVNDVIHKTYIAVDGFGTKAGAATAVVVELQSAPIEERITIDITLDRPFVYMIVDCENGVPVFIGVLEKPRD